jgi:hypothetical protein
VLVFHQRIDPDSRTGRGSAWIAETIVNGATCSARSRSGAPFELARDLISVGAPDQPVQVYTAGIAGCITYRSLAQMAQLTIAEGAAAPIGKRKWSEFRGVGGKTGGEGGGDDVQPHKLPEGDKTPDATPLAAISAK